MLHVTQTIITASQVNASISIAASNGRMASSGFESTAYILLRLSNGNNSSACTVGRRLRDVKPAFLI